MNERKLIDEIKLAVQQEAIAGYWNGRVFVSDDKKTYTNIISNSQPIGVGFIVPYDGRWLLVVGSNNSEGRKNIINSKRKRLVPIVEENLLVKTIFLTRTNFEADFYFNVGGDAPSRKVKGNVHDANLSGFGSLVNLGKGDKYSADILYVDYTVTDGTIYIVYISKTGKVVKLEVTPLIAGHGFSYIGGGRFYDNKKILNTENVSNSSLIRITNTFTNQSVDKSILTTGEGRTRVFSYYPELVPDDLYVGEVSLAIGNIIPLVSDDDTGNGVQRTRTIAEEGYSDNWVLHSYLINHEESEANIDLNYEFLKVGEDVTFTHTCNFTKKYLNLTNTPRYFRSVEPYENGSVLIDGVSYAGITYNLQSFFISWLTNTNSISLNNRGIITSLNVDKYLLFSINGGNTNSDLSEASVIVDEPFSRIDFLGNGQDYNVVEGFYWAAQFTSDSSGFTIDPLINSKLLNYEQYPFGEQLDNSDFDYAEWAERERYNPVKYIGEEILCFFNKFIDGKTKYFYGIGNITEVIILNENTRSTQFSITFSDIEETKFPVHNNILTLNNGSFYSFYLLYYNYFYGNLQVLCTELLKAVVFRNNLPKVQRSFVAVSSSIPAPIGNEWLFNQQSLYNSEIIGNLQLSILNNTNIVKNKIYCTTPIQNSSGKVTKMGIAQWNITDDGKILFEKTFIVDYLPDKRLYYPQNASYHPN